jgi:hypothetical protein
MSLPYSPQPVPADSIGRADVVPGVRLDGLQEQDYRAAGSASARYAKCGHAS